MELCTRRARSMGSLYLFPFPLNSKQDWEDVFRTEKSKYFLVVVIGAVNVV